MSVRLPMPPEEQLSEKARIQSLENFWQTLMKGSDSGATTWEVLEYLNYRIWRCLGDDPPDVDLAESLTAQALLKITGQTD